MLSNIYGHVLKQSLEEADATSLYKFIWTCPNNGRTPIRLHFPIHIPEATRVHGRNNISFGNSLVNKGGCNAACSSNHSAAIEKMYINITVIQEQKMSSNSHLQSNCDAFTHSFFPDTIAISFHPIMI